MMFYVVSFLSECPVLEEMRRYDLAVDAVLRKLGNRRLCPDFSLFIPTLF